MPVKCVGFDGFALMPVKSKRPLGPALRALLMAVRVAIGEMLAQKEDVHLIGPDQVADDQVVCPVIAAVAEELAA